MEILGNVKNYEWGKFGVNSKVAQLAQLNDSSFVVDSKQTYSELWMGDHPSGPSKFKSTGECLRKFLQTNKNDYIGGMSELPFLFKVLSINKALSIQVHPNKEEAEKLHSLHPDLYKDPNHKPELAIALTPFLALCGFRPLDEVHNLLSKYPEFIDLLGQETIENIKINRSSGLKESFSKLIHSSESDTCTCIRKLNEKIEKETNSNSEDLIPKIFKTLNKDFPNDVGVLSIFFLNILYLEPGQAIYLPANEPHAYLDGDCVECMACSDNVVRAGLTPKFKDVETLIKMLNYNGEPIENKIFKPKPHPLLKHTQMFIPDVKDFAVAKIEVPTSERKYVIENRSFGSILLVLNGTGKLTFNDIYSSLDVKAGSIVFLPSNSGNEISVDLFLEDEPFVAYQAMFNDF